ncbi:thymidine phosphorylase family protein [Methylophaga thalassica]|uniref:thymidine phosphorylase family protein n=1 Tax=Methylophaga thalassica TaxID=40223 RepID=UPI002E7C5444|nr:thymidine phosphorylase family protein [Methylophaga thalassica]WVI83675.1 thymidine phosphorylase family protein [Methylophaga thalassica]
MTTSHLLSIVDMGIDTHQEPVVYMRSDCHICRSEGFTANSRVTLRFNENSVIATLNVVDGQLLPSGTAGLSRIAMHRLSAIEGQKLMVSHAPVVTSLSHVRKKVFGNKLSDDEIADIIKDISAHRYSDIEIASFLSVCAGSRLDVDEIIGLTQAMVECGKRLSWSGQNMILDKHCIGGLPGNRTTPLVVSIVSAAGLVIPKTSSRAITSPAGTADTMETLTTVNLNLKEIQCVVADTNACLAWGGAVNLSPADDLLIRIERALDLDGEGQLIASVLSKKIAAGSTHAVVDIPVGPTAKVRSDKEANRLASLFTQVGAACGINIRCLITDGSQPVGLGIGPVEEARDVLSVLQRGNDAPLDLRERALFLAANLFSLSYQESVEQGLLRATSLLDSGKAWQQFQRIVQAQGGIKQLPDARYQHTELVPEVCSIAEIDNRKLARLAKLAGAPGSPAAGVRLHAKVGDTLSKGEPLFTLFSDSEGERDYALAYYSEQGNPFTINLT